MTPHLSERALILAPRGRDAEVAAGILGEAGFHRCLCPSIKGMVDEIAAGAGFGIVTEEALRTADLHSLAAWIAAQPEWSDFPFILLTQRGGGLERNPAAIRYLDALGNVTFLERPFHPTTLVSLARSARRARQRQYEARSRLQELHALTEVLERRVEERTLERQAAMEQLHEAQKLETLGQLTGGVAHDFNNLLTPIVGALDMLQREMAGKNARTERWIANALQAGDRAKTLVQRLLGFARRQELHTASIDLAALIRGMRDLISSSLGPQIELEVHCDDNLPHALADPNQLELAILNLCVNSRDAMPDGGTLKISVEAIDLGSGSGQRLAAGRYVRLSVRDTGLGMDAATLARAIEPFFSTKETGRGTGLGLSMVHGLMGQLGGAFLLHSSEGQGTCALLYLPVAESAAEPAVDGGANLSSLVFTSLSVLVVDDEDLVRHGTGEMLRTLGHHVVEAGSGSEALAVLAKRPDVEALVTDYKMPRMDGAELARRVRACRPEVAILLISGFTGAADPIDKLPRLNKPFGLSELAEGLQAALVQRDARLESLRRHAPTPENAAN